MYQQHVYKGSIYQGFQGSHGEQSMKLLFEQSMTLCSLQSTGVEPLPERDITETHNVPLQKHYIFLCVLFSIYHAALSNLRINVQDVYIL